jgi:hypothetical protein
LGRSQSRESSSGKSCHEHYQKTGSEEGREKGDEENWC